MIGGNERLKPNVWLFKVESPTVRVGLHKTNSRVLETVALSGTELTEYCREKGIYVEQIEWLQEELDIKECALAETTALF